MRILMALAMPFLLSGCMAMGFDNREYDGYLMIAESADGLSLKCDVPSDVRLAIPLLSSNISHMVAYSNGRALWRPNFAAAAQELNGLTAELVYHYSAMMSPSAAYCRNKLLLIAAASRLISIELGRL